MKRFALLSLLITNLAVSQVNGGFEMWDTVFTPQNYMPDLISMGIADPKSGKVTGWNPGSASGIGAGVCRTNDSHSGNYALILHNWYGYAYETISYDAPISWKPLFLQGYFKYLTKEPSGTAGGQLQVWLSRFNGISGDTIAKGSYSFSSAANYQSFLATLNYRSLLAPDSIHIWVLNGVMPCTAGSICNFLYLDDLALDNGSLGSKELNNEKRCSVFPVPAINELHIQYPEIVRISLRNLQGDVVLDTLVEPKTAKISLETLATGAYFYMISNQEGMIRSGKIIRD